jgi:raffinose/stachyose/melibiose transport system substrate-binding protein
MLSTKNFLLLITILLICLLTVSIGQQKIKITWWYESATPEDVEAMQKDIIEPYIKAHPNVEIELTVKENLQEVLRTAMGAGEGPDIVMTMGPAEANRYAAAGLLLPLDEYIKKAGLDKEIPSLLLDVGKVKGKIYSIPKTIESMGILYNKSLFDENNWKVPTNYKEWTALCDAIKKKGILPVAAGNSGWRPTNEHFVTVYLNNYAGPENVYRALRGLSSWTEPVFVKAIETFKNDFLNYWPRYDIYSSIGANEFVNMVSSRKAAMLVVGTWAFQWTGNPDYWVSKDKWGWAPFPSLREGVEYPIANIGIGTTLSVNKKSKYPDVVADFLISIFKNKEGIAKLLRDYPGEWVAPIDIPSNLVPPEVDPVFYSAIKTQYDLVKKGKYGYTTWTFLGPETWQWCYEGIEQVWLGKISALDYMKKWNDIFKKELKEGLVPPIPIRR